MPLSVGEHRVTLKSNGRRVDNWISYDIQIDMLRAGDAFSLSLGPADPIGEEFGNVWETVRPDSLVELYLDDVRILSGYIDDREGSSTTGGDTISVSGRSKDGRLIDESMSIVSFKGLTLEDLVAKIVQPYFPRVLFDNAENRALTIGRGRGARGGRVIREPKHAGKQHRKAHKRMYRKVEPGETRQAVLDYYLKESDLIAWASADGEAMIVATPNYDQEPTFSFFHGRAMSPRQVRGNCASFKVRDSVGERYSQIITLGSNTGNVRDFATNIKHHKGVASNGPGPLGVGGEFQRRKVLIVSDDGLQNDEQAQTRADREMAERDATGHTVELSVFGHSQAIGFGAVPALYACDTMAQVESEVFGVKGLYLITSVHFQRDRQNGETTTLQLVPKGTLLKV
jgi:prophage tail gpP-like protein